MADYGIWERGDKGNHGLPERNASSIGLVKAALEALEGLDLYGPHGDGSATLVIPHDAIVRLRRALRGLLPRESASKEVDSACLAVIGYPACSVEDPRLVERTRSKIRSELGGAYGYKRFRRDGHQTVIEDHTRLHYEREELAQFEHIECEWPLFWAYELITACCEERWAEARQWRQRLAGVSVMAGGNALLPELYRVPREAIAAERRQPGSQPREANENVPLLWTQSLTWLADLLLAGLITPGDLDPSNRRLTASLGASEVLVALVPANPEIGAALEAAGLPLAGDGLTVASSAELAARMARVGANGRLGLSGHPPVRMETMATARLYRSADGRQTMAFLPAVLEESTFYLADDAEQLIDSVSAELRLLQRHWRGSGAPLLLIPVAEGAYRSDPDAFVRLGQDLRGGLLDGAPVQLAPLAELQSQACWQTLPPEACGAAPLGEPHGASPLRASTQRAPLSAEEELELEDSSIGDLLERLWQSTSLQEQAEVLALLSLRLGPAAQLQGPQHQHLSLKDLLGEVYRRALEQGDWSVVRRTAAALELAHPQLEDALTDLLLRQRQLVVGRNYTHDSLISEPLGSRAIAAMIRRFSGDDGREWMLQQELLLALDCLARHEPDLLSGRAGAQPDRGLRDAVQPAAPRHSPATAGRAGRPRTRPRRPAAQGTAAPERTGALDRQRTARRPSPRWLLAAAPRPPGGPGPGAAGFLPRHLGAAAPLPRHRDRRQARQTQPTREQAAAAREDPRRAQLRQPGGAPAQQDRGTRLPPAVQRDPADPDRLCGGQPPGVSR